MAKASMKGGFEGMVAKKKEKRVKKAEGGKKSKSYFVRMVIKDLLIF
jgi:hypothetical protein